VANLPLAFSEILAGGLFVAAAVTGDPIANVINGAVSMKPLPGSSAGATLAGAATDAIGGAPSSGKDGKLIGKPVDRPGVATGQAILDFARKVAGVYGKPVTLGTGTAHNRLTVNGNVSAHWSGNALDLPARGAANIALGRAALVAAGMGPSQAAQATGGIYNVGGYQIIFNTHEGGDHTNHVHIGRRG